MIVENDLDSARRLEHFLSERGHEVVMGGELYYLDDIREHGSIDMLITNIYLEHTSGLRIVMDVKGFNPDIKVVAISGAGALDGTDYLHYAVEFGADAVMRKPVDKASMDAVLSRFTPPVCTADRPAALSA